MVSVILTLRDQLSNNSVKGAFGVFFFLGSWSEDAINELSIFKLMTCA